MSWTVVRAIVGGCAELASVALFLGALLLWADALSAV